jgi:hypothetical protein
MRRIHHMPELRVDAWLAPSPDREVDAHVSPVVDQARPAGTLLDSGVCPRCLARNAIERPVDLEGWGDRPQRTGPCVSCGQQLFYLTGDTMLIVWDMGD